MYPPWGQLNNQISWTQYLCVTVTFDLCFEARVPKQHFWENKPMCTLIKSRLTVSLWERATAQISTDVHHGLRPTLTAPGLSQFVLRWELCVHGMSTSQSLCWGRAVLCKISTWYCQPLHYIYKWGSFSCGTELPCIYLDSETLQNLSKRQIGKDSQQSLNWHQKSFIIWDAWGGPIYGSRNRVWQ